MHDKRQFYDYKIIHDLKRQLTKRNQKIDITDLGAGANQQLKKQRNLKDIAKNSAISKKFGELLFRIVQHYEPNTILELGTCLGIGSLYMASPSSKNKLITIEGDPELAKIAAFNFDNYPKPIATIENLVGHFDDVLPNVLKANPKIDLVFIDGNHKKAPTLQYFQQILPHCDEHSILIFDDIYWSKEMAEAWAVIKQHPSISLSVDLFRMGLVFFAAERKEAEHFKVYF